MHIMLCRIVAACLLIAPLPAWAAGRVELEIALAKGSSPLAAQTWNRVLAEAKATNVLIRARKSTDAVGIEVLGTQSSPVYKVTGLIDDRNELQLPGARFSERDASRLAAWIKKLAEEGPGGENKPARPFGLSEADLKLARADLRAAVDFSTAGMDRKQAIASIKRKLAQPLETPAAFDAALTAAGPIAEELKGMSAGSAVAAILRPAGLALAPRKVQSTLGYVVFKPAAGGEVWPVGFSSDKRIQDLMPVLFEQINVEIEKNTLAEVFSALGPRLNVPVLVDHNSLAYHNIDLEKTEVSLDARKLPYSLILRKVLGQAKLVYEVRVDEAEKPFVWITAFERVPAK
jgi:hypothetical protein